MISLANSGSKWVSAAFLQEVANDMSFHGPDSCLPIRYLFGQTIGDGIRTWISVKYLRHMIRFAETFPDYEIVSKASLTFSAKSCLDRGFIRKPLIPSALAFSSEICSEYPVHMMTGISGLT